MGGRPLTQTTNKSNALSKALKVISAKAFFEKALNVLRTFVSKWQFATSARVSESIKRRKCTQLNALQNFFCMSQIVEQTAFKRCGGDAMHNVN